MVSVGHDERSKNAGRRSCERHSDRGWWRSVKHDPRSTNVFGTGLEVTGFRPGTQAESSRPAQSPKGSELCPGRTNPPLSPSKSGGAAAKGRSSTGPQYEKCGKSLLWTSFVHSLNTSLSIEPFLRPPTSVNNFASFTSAFQYVNWPVRDCHEEIF